MKEKLQSQRRSKPQSQRGANGEVSRRASGEPTEKPAERQQKKTTERQQDRGESMAEKKPGRGTGEELPVNPLFEEAKRRIIGAERQRQGIGTLSEKTVHAILKLYYAPDTDQHEIPIENYVADIYTGKEIIEIQTRQFNRMRDKLSVFLEQYPVTIVYPIPRYKWLIWIDEETGALSKPRRSPRKGNVYMAFPELYKIKMFLTNPGLHLKFVLLDMEEYRLLNGWSRDRKKGSHRFDRIPSALVEEVSVDGVLDYMQFVPYELEGDFTSKDFAQAAHISRSLAQTVLNILTHVGCVSREGKQGNNILYRVREIL